MSEGINESRFYMWRAVFAMAHADNIVTADEKDFMEGYLKNVPFSDEQKETLQNDMIEAQDVHEMFSMVTDLEDQSAFFQFSRELVWCDGDLDRQEEEIKSRLTSEQMGRLNVDRIETELKRTRAEGKMKRTATKRAMKEEAEKSLGIVGFIKKIFGR